MSSRGRSSSGVVIVGGGVIGCAIAYYLARAGLRPTVLERDRIGSGASGAAAGMLAPLSEAHGPGTFFDLLMASLHLFPELLGELRELAPAVDIEHNHIGVLRVALDEDELAQLRQRFEWLEASGGRSQWLSAAEALEAEPGLSKRLAAAILSPAEQQLDPLRLTQALATAARGLGAEIREGVSATGLVRDGDHVTGIRTSGGIEPAEHAVLAAGAWCGHAATIFGASLPMRPVRGQLMSLSGLQPPLRHIIWGSKGYLSPRPGGGVWAGTTVEEAGFRPRTTVAGLRRIRSAANRLVPGLRDARVDASWAGLRPAAADGLPVLGPLPGWGNVTIAAGHFRNGILLAPITGRIIAQLIAEGRTEADLTPYRPDRF